MITVVMVLVAIVIGAVIAAPFFSPRKSKHPKGPFGSNLE